MNILPKKSWHVRTRDNIARVKKDEALAAEEEKKKELKIALAEQEARTEQLRIKAKTKYETNSTSSTQPSSAPDVLLSDATAVQPLPRQHINFFSEIESGNNTATANKDNEAEKKKEQEAYEKKIGLLTYLGQSASETQAVKPWYQQVRKQEEDEKDTIDTDTNDLKRKASLDPMNDMMRFMGNKPKSGGAGTKTNSPRHPKTSHATQGLPETASILSMFSKYKSKSKDDEKEGHRDNKRRKSHKESKSRKHSRKHHKKSHRGDRKHKKRRHRSRHRSSDDSENTSDSDDQSPRESKRGPSIEQMRAERLRREAAERAKTERLLSGKPLVEKPVVDSVITDKLDGKYNSQFNPHLARKRQPREPLF